MENAVNSGKIGWKSPSNIALVKYWGKHGNQLPANASISFTLDKCYTESTLEYSAKEDDGSFDITIYLDGKLNEKFKEKVLTFFSKIVTEMPFLTEYSFILNTHNSFPHSSGIASSASGMSALALCLCFLESQIKNKTMDKDTFLRRASYFSRIGSGSACRSVYGGLVVWGKHPEIPGSSDEYGIPYPFEAHDVFKTFNDTILLVHEGQKSVSSTVGHNLMHGHPFAAQRFEEAGRNLSRLIPVLKSGDLDEFGSIVEKEALMLHAMMMTSTPSYILMQPNTLAVIEKVWEYRRETGTPLFFTLDAGANIHLLYPDTVADRVNTLVENVLSTYCENKKYICDNVGQGAEPITPDR